MKHWALNATLNTVHMDVGIDETALIKPSAGCYLRPRIPNYVLFSMDMYAVITHNSIQSQTWHIQTEERM